jgi:hypothetical protein
MSTGLNCEFIRVTDEGKPDQYYYILEDCNSPKMAWDWREYARAYGPFRTEQLAQEDLRRWHANPGGSTHGDMTLAEVEADPVLNKLIFEDLPQSQAEFRQYCDERWRQLTNGA